ncbi:Cys-tRNA(Pro)/Cys-tRNA(Cys) deacylase YbaK [Planctomycetes bacterium Poly30]|uniref:Cys-tRNA(Pro)/Cys-tRNA(Cys) deacylase n=1 Tax=Saltatorellus ferox TaxID=2528018 RepID=A0A518EXI3_9BACT|nr:Cys-tRNA(Pro)/Cys-tRNA(Cys) deacylase YbaK [Planctomycetes bacterium Poly30]
MGKKKRQPGGTPATAKLDALGLEYLVLTYDPEALEDLGSLGESVAHALGVDPPRMFKTLITLVDGAPTCAIVPTSSELSLKALARAAGGKRAEMAAPADAEKWTGYVTGGISPIGQARSMRRLVDASAEDHEKVVVSAGKRGLQIELPVAALLRASNATTAPLCTP